MAVSKLKRNVLIGVNASKSFSVSAGSFVDVSVDFSSAVPSGYKLVAVNSVTFSGTYSEYLALSNFSISNGNKTVGIRVRSLASSSAISGSATVWVVCAENYTT